MGKKKIVSKFKSQVVKEGSIECMISELEEELGDLPKHLLQSDWQYAVYRSLRKNVPLNTVVMVLDFGENFRTFNQNEVQSAHFAYRQITVHPVVCHYNCITCEGIVQEVCVCLTDDLVHDHQAVQAFTAKVLDHLRGKGIECKTCLQFTDGCSAHYRSKKPFMDLSQSESNLGCVINRNYFEKGHGKSLADGAIAVTKRVVRQAITSDDLVITSVEDMTKFLRREKQVQGDMGECCHSQSMYFNVVYDRKKEMFAEPAQRVLGTLDIHQAKTVEPGVIAVRNMSCVCEGCTNGDASQCVNKEYVQEFDLQGCSKSKQLELNKGSMKPTSTDIKKTKPMSKDNKQTKPTSKDIEQTKPSRKVKDRSAGKSNEVKMKRPSRKLTEKSRTKPINIKMKTPKKKEGKSKQTKVKKPLTSGRVKSKAEKELYTLVSSEEMDTDETSDEAEDELYMSVSSDEMYYTDVTSDENWTPKNTKMNKSAARGKGKCKDRDAIKIDEASSESENDITLVDEVKPASSENENEKTLVDEVKPEDPSGPLNVHVLQPPDSTCPLTFEDAQSLLLGSESYEDLEHVVVETKSLLPSLPDPPTISVWRLWQ
jgi:hypothetical protein